MISCQTIVVALSILVLCCRITESVKFPDGIERCPVGDEKCIMNESTKVLKILPNGHNGINLLPLDPLYIPKIVIKQGKESPVNIELIFTNNKLSGLSKLHFYKMTGFQSTPEGKYELRLKGPILHLLGPYTINGRILILPIQGVGESNITIVDPDLTFKFDGKPIMKNGKVFLQPDNAKLSFELSRIIFFFGNLYNGDKALGDNTNLFLNEHWKEVFPEVRGSIFEVFSKLANEVVANVFNKIPFDELFTGTPN